MDGKLITADEKNRATGGSLRSPESRRTLQLVWPHRRFIIIGLLSSIVFGMLHSVSIIGVLPVLKVMLTDEGLHGWIDQSVTRDRMRVELVWDDDAYRVIKSKAAPSAEGVTLSPGDRVVGFTLAHENPEGGSQDAPEAADHWTAHDLCQAVANDRAATGASLFVLSSAADGTQVVTLPLKRASTKWRALRAVVSMIPRPQQRSDRVYTLIWVLGFVVLIAILSNVARFISQYYVGVGVLRGVMDLRRMLYRKVLRLPMAFFASDVADIVSRFVQDAQEIQRGLMALFGKLLREPIKAFFLLIAALWVDARLTLALLVVAPAAVLIFLVIGRKIRKANRRLLQIYGVMIGALSSTLNAIGVVKAYGAENIERKRLWQIDRKMFVHMLRIVRLEAFLRPLLEVLAIVGIAAVTVWLGSQVIMEKVRIEDFATLVLLLGMLIDPLRKMSDVYPRVMRSTAASTRIFSVLDAPEEEELSEGAIEIPPLAEEIRLDHVTFTYPNAPEPALRDVSVSIACGETVAIVGGNGSGKTTLTRLLNRFYDPQEGVVTFDGRNIRNVTLRSLRKQISVVTQDPVVFAMSLAENIAYGSRNASRDRIMDAARQAHADEFIRAKTGAYDELAGDQGSTLSGGQRQRLCIARAIYRNAPILIFDEATSQIDSESERKIQDAIREISEGKTTILIAHRLSTIRFAKRIIVMDSGRIIDSGTHEELLARCEPYATLCATQLVE
ncbi:MAG: ABC transporter ATP-binding protein [Phycisphaerales bacterium]|nr:ABC transporter ATP-binding protein [Phycisphaerales bacterium]